ncbi:unnamed protein product, partial [Mesorhabditis belari]|uniref:Uncharacterized protein n=1 Tax=Mesorhabditis belari TaxID=2138241 RepID=A0AAF3EK45_9BILA
MGDAFDRKVEQITCDELPEIREELYEFGKKLNDKVNLIRARNKEMWDEIYGKTGNIEYAMNLLERTLDVDEEVQQVKELLKKIEKKLKQEITSNQNVNRTMSSASFEEMNGSSVELIPDDYIPPPPYEEADCDLVNRSSPESANPLRPILKRDGYSVPVEENIDRRSRPVTRNRSRSRRRPSITVDDEVAEKRIQGIYTGPQFVFENRNRSLRHIQVEFSYEAKRHGIRDDGQKEAGYYPFIRMKALGQMKDDGQHDWQEWTIRFDRRENKWFPRFDRDPPRDNVDYRK